MPLILLRSVRLRAYVIDGRRRRRCRRFSINIITGLPLLDRFVRSQMECHFMGSEQL